LSFSVAIAGLFFLAFALWDGLFRFQPAAGLMFLFSRENAAYYMEWHILLEDIESKALLAICFLNAFEWCRKSK